ncbi:hypothetical protein M9Y10_021345 [Tritrichomonas musculus]|uniref:Leucine Rich Repeat family protein n=1 Tax=Tritrichomonas musculus TaxID=1915356 RepID=A0ABR2HES1_9EUKA
MCTSTKIWEEESPIARSFQDIVDLSEHSEQLNGKTITFEGIIIEPQMEEYLYKIARTEYLEKMIYNNCIIDEDNIYTIFIPSFYQGNTFGIINCNLNTDQVKEVLFQLLDPCCNVSFDFSNNKLGENGSEFLEYLSKKVMDGIHSLTLKDNGFKEEDISNFMKKRIDNTPVYF